MELDSYTEQSSRRSAGAKYLEIQVASENGFHIAEHALAPGGGGDQPADVGGWDGIQTAIERSRR
jgi:hypothetical protein